MGRPLAPPPVFDDASPWGRYVPSLGMGMLLAVSHALPGWLRRLTLVVRRPIKYGVHTPLDVNIWGLQLRLLPRGNMSEQKLLFAPQFFDPEELAQLRERLPAEGCFVDIGANAGVYSLWAHHCMQGRGRIISVEPDPEMRRRLAFNLASNQIGDIEVCPVALSDHAGSAELQVNLAQRGENTLVAAEAQRAGGERQAVTVELDTLLHLLQARGVTRVHALKIDIEGHEPPVLRHFLENAPATLWPDLVITEFKAETAPMIEALFTTRGYRRRTTTRLNFIFERMPPG